VIATQIKTIAENLPSELGGSSFSPPSIVLPGERKISFSVDSSLSPFIHVYKNPAIGWHSAAIFASTGKRFPIPLSGEDHWVFKAYLYCLNPDKYSDPNVLEAIMLSHPEMKGIRDVIESLLMTSDHDKPSQISKALGISERTVSAYEKLFFNVLDRKKDLMYLRNLVYPDSRLVEMFDGYAASEDFGMLMRRYGYNHNGSELLYLAGMPVENFALEMSSAQSAGKLEGVLMSQGFLLTKLGFVNQTQNAQAIFHARSVIAAAKQGGQDTSGEDSPLSSVSELLYETFRDQGREAAGQMIQKRKETRYKDHGVVVEV
jgi:hypothetical protein